MTQTHLNLPGRLAQAFVESRLTLLLMLATLAFGLIGLAFTAREENPQIVVPVVEVRIPLPGATPEEVENILLSPLEATLTAIRGVKHSYGTALPGLAAVLVEFEVGQDEKGALLAVSERLHRFEAPTGSGEARIKAVDVDDVPVFTLALASESLNDYELRRVAERVLERLRGVPGVSLGYVVGGRSREFRLETTPERLQAFGVTLDHIASAVAASNAAGPLSGRVRDGQFNRMRLEERLASAEQIAGISLHRNNQNALRLGDIVEVRDGPDPDVTHYTRFGFGAADARHGRWDGRELSVVTVALAKRKGINAVALTANFRERIDEMSKSFIPQGVMAIITRDDGMKADRTIAALVEHLGIAIAAVGLILLVFLGPRPALIVAAAIPLVLAIVIGADLLAGPTLNRITLYALILSLGMLVDDATVVVENIYRHYHHIPADADVAARTAAAVAATKEIGNPTTLATFTIVVVFLSLGLVTGMLGDYFYPIVFNVPVAMVASLLFAYSVTPWMARRWLRSGTSETTGSKWLQQGYRAAIALLMIRRRLRHGFYLLILLLLAGSFLQPAWQFIRPQGVAGPVSAGGLPLAFLPKDNKNTFLVHIHLPETTPLETADRAAREVEVLLRRHSFVLNFTTHVGIPAVADFNSLLRGTAENIGPNYAEIRVNLTEKAERDRTSIELVVALRPAIAEVARRYPGGIIQLVEDPPGPPVRATVLAELYGPDAKTLNGLTHMVADAFRQTHDMAEVWTSVPTDVPEYRFHVRRDKAAMANVTPAQVLGNLARLVDGEILALAYPEGERAMVPVRLVVPRAQRVDPEALERAYVENPQGRRIPLSELVDVIKDVSRKPIHHKDSERVQVVGGELAGSAPVYAIIDLETRLNKLDLGNGGRLATANLGLFPARADPLRGYQLLWEGELRLTLDAFRDMGMALGLAIAAIFLLLVGYYQSFRLALLALVAVPLGFIGVFPAHWLLGTTFSAASMVGIIALAGVVVRNSLLIIDFARDYQRQGYSPEEAAQEAGAVRLRPILLTTLAIALGTWIMVPDPTFGGLAISLIFGSLTSAVFSLFLVPLLYRSMRVRQPGRGGSEGPTTTRTAAARQVTSSSAA